MGFIMRSQIMVVQSFQIGILLALVDGLGVGAWPGCVSLSRLGKYRLHSQPGDGAGRKGRRSKANWVNLKIVTGKDIASCRIGIDATIIVRLFRTRAR